MPGSRQTISGMSNKLCCQLKFTLGSVIRAAQQPFQIGDDTLEVVGGVIAKLGNDTVGKAH